MIKDFSTFIGESLGVTGDHFEKRAKTRLKDLKIIGFVDASGKNIQVSSNVSSEATQFFQNALFRLADIENSIIFEKVDIPLGKIAIIRLGKPVVILEDGRKVNPVFEVYERMSDSDPKKTVMRTGTCFWIFTTGSTVRTIKLYDTDGTKQADRNILIDKSIEHMRTDRESELSRLSRVHKMDFTDIDVLRENHLIVLKPAGLDTVSLDLSSDISPSQQLSEFISNTQVSRQEKIHTVYTPPTTDIVLEKVPKQMNVTPDKVWVLERNEKFDTWGARPITSSKLVKGARDNSITIMVGSKHIHWLDLKKPVFNAPTPSNLKTIQKGDKITLAKQLGNGEWLANTGTIKEISIDPKSEYPYVKTDGWDKSEIIPAELANKMFVYETKLKADDTNESRFILSFESWLIESARH